MKSKIIATMMVFLGSTLIETSFALSKDLPDPTGINELADEIKEDVKRRSKELTDDVVDVVVPPPDFSPPCCG